MGVSRQANKTRKFAQVIVHQSHVSGFNGRTSTGCAHRKANVCSGQSWRIVDAVSHHPDGTTQTDLAFYGFEFVFRQ